MAFRRLSRSAAWLVGFVAFAGCGDGQGHPADLSSGGGDLGAGSPGPPVGGTVTGLAGGGLVLQNNGGDDLAVTAAGPFAFATALGDGATYDVTIKTQPTSPTQLCADSNGT